MISVVAFDLSLSSTGVATPDGPSIHKAPSAGALHDRINALACSLVDVADAWNADLVVIEDLIVAGPGSGKAVIPLGMLHGVVRHQIAVHRGYDLVVIAPSSLKRYATGKGNASKALVLVEAVKRLGYVGSSDDEADALWLHAMAMDHAGAPPVVVPASHREALDKIAWPELPVPA